MKKSRIYLLGIIAAVLLCGCEKKSEQTEELSESAAFSETVFTSSEKSAAAETEAVKKEIEPLSHGRDQAYFQNEEFSVTAELITLQSSLYYPDVIHDFGANPEMFVVTVFVKAKNLTDETRDFDETKLSVPNMFYCGGDAEKFKDIKSGKSAAGELRFLCSLEQAAEIDGILYGGEYLETGEDFYPEEFGETVDIQSADDVREYLYRQHRIHWYSGYYTISGQPTQYEMNNIRGIKKDGKNYLAVTYTGYNRSDYAQIIDPSGFTFLCSEYKDKGSIAEVQFFYDEDGSLRNSVTDDTVLEPVEPLYINVDEGLVYAPGEAGVELDGMGKIYELPEYICMNPENPTVFTIIYDLKNYDRLRRFIYNDSHENEPYYSSVEKSPILDWDIWEEKNLES